MLDGPKYPDVHVKLTGGSGNAFAIIGKVASAMRSQSVPNEDIRQFHAEAMAVSDYNHLLRKVMEWVEVE